MRDQVLKVSIEDGEVVIRIGIDTLKVAAEACPELEECLGSGYVVAPSITDIDLFAAEVVRELGREAEDGTTPVHILLDAAFVAAAEQGAEGIEFPEDTP